jgi:coenzyme F420-reducing hydrogenase delta subunit
VTIYVFYCSTSIGHDDLAAALNGISAEDWKLISLPCSGKADVLYILKAFETGADGVVVATCKRGECRYLEGNLRASKRTAAVESILEEIGLGRGRVLVVEAGGESLSATAGQIAAFRKKLSETPIVVDYDTLGKAK